MRIFFRKTVLFLLPILIYAFLFECVLRKIPNDYMIKDKYLQENASLVQTLIVGSSHTYSALNPVYFDSKTFNAAYVSQSLDFDYEIIMKHADRFQSLKTIIVPISYFSLFGSLRREHETWRVKNYVIYYNLHSSYNYHDYFEILSNQFSANWERCNQYLFNNKNDINCSELGWGKNYKMSKAKDLKETGNSASWRHTKQNLDSKETQQKIIINILSLEGILDWSIKKGIKVIFLTTPTYHTYWEKLNSEQLEVTLSFIQKLVDKNENCVYYNFLKDTTFLATDFYDADHLNEQGAEKFSIILNNKLQ